MDTYWIWWLVAVALVIAEMSSGTFYLIAVALGLAVAGLSAYMGMGWGGQVTVAALLCTASVVAIYRWKQGQGESNGQSNLAYDIGQSVQVVQWKDERHARVSYRGAEWDADLASAAAADTTRQTWRIKEVAGSHLVIE